MKQAYRIDGSEIFGTDYDANVKSIAHRGYSLDAPENTLPAYRLAAQKGFRYAETDVQLTSDGVPVCIHDATIDRTSNGTGNVSGLTWAQLQTYDFGSWKSSQFTGTKIPSFEQFVRCCKNLCLHPYIEISQNASFSQAQVENLVDIVNKCGMRGKVTWISFSSTYLGYVKNYDPSARLGFLLMTITSTNITTANGLKTGNNDVFINSRIYTTTDDMINLCIAAGLPLEAWEISAPNNVIRMNPYISGVTTNCLLAGKVLRESEPIVEISPPVNQIAKYPLENGNHTFSSNNRRLTISDGNKFDFANPNSATSGAGAFLNIAKVSDNDSSGSSAANITGSSTLFTIPAGSTVTFAVKNVKRYALNTTTYNAGLRSGSQEPIALGSATTDKSVDYTTTDDLDIDMVFIYTTNAYNSFNGEIELTVNGHRWI